MAGVTRVEKAINPVMGGGTEREVGTARGGEVERHWRGGGGLLRGRALCCHQPQPTLTLTNQTELEAGSPPGHIKRESPSLDQLSKFWTLGTDNPNHNEVDIFYESGKIISKEAFNL